MKQEQEPERLGCCCQKSLTTHLYSESFFFLASFWCSQPYAGHSGLSEGVEFSFPPQGALQSMSLFPKHPSCPTLSCPVRAPHPRPPSGLLCLLAVPSRGHVPACPQSSPGHRSTFLGQNQSCPQGHPCSGNPGHPLTLSLQLVSPRARVAARGDMVVRDKGTAGQAAAWGRCITPGDLEGGEAVPFPACTARVSQGCTFTRRQRLAEPRKSERWVRLPRGRLPP